MNRQETTSDRLRSDIDRGRAGDKVSFPDPAAAPLGVDDEAAGAPPTARQIDAAHRIEIRDRADDPSARRARRPSAQRGARVAFWAAVTIAALLAAAAIMALTAP